MSKEAKLLRGQIRQIVKEILPELLSGELIGAIDAKLTKQITTRLELLTSNVKDTMKQIDDRSKDVQGYLVRQVTSTPAVEPAKTEEVSSG